jgi:hypothetical protein
VPEKHLVSDLAIRGERPQRLLPLFAGLLVHVGDGAPRAGLDDSEADAPNAHPPPPILLVRDAARNDDVGPEAVYGQRAVQPRVQVVERRLEEQQEREAVGEADPVCGVGVERVHGSFGLVGHVDQAT